ncbi:MAG: N-acetylmuramoyl-L-alanine amidase [Heliobacteriaceae bacterium]|jgi:N-acetylmuramoyl-L-alanine amidase/GH24 family phage-related lysozyme (muramidase)|nr:N-acetylmuramoyl-L-alanine amidase [Heliobacteriaceae bacterium]
MTAGKVKLIMAAITVAGLGGFVLCGRKKKPEPDKPAAIYPIKPGDGVAKIAKGFGMTADELREAANLQSDVLCVGDTLRVDSTFIPPVHKIEPGNTIWALAKKYELPEDEFKKRTGLNGNDIKAGQSLNLNGIVPQPRKNYTVKKSDNFKDLALKYNFIKENGEADVEAFKKYSGVKKLKQGEIITVPTVAIKTAFWSIASANSMSQSELEELNPQITDLDHIGEGTRINVPIRAFDSGEDSVIQQVPGGDTAADSELSVQKPRKPMKDNKLVAEKIILNPTQSGPLNNKIVIVDAGHHWGYNKKGEIVFAPGAVVGKAQEWKFNRILALKLADEFRAQGATIVFTSGGAELIQDVKTEYRNNCAAFISVHNNAVDIKENPSKARIKGALVIYYDGTSEKPNKKSNDFAKAIETGYPGKCEIRKDTETDHKKLRVLRVEEHIPSIMIEAGYLTNKEDLANLKNSDYQNKIVKHITNGVVAYLAPGKTPVINDTAPKPVQTVTDKTGQYSSHIAFAASQTKFSQEFIKYIVDIEGVFLTPKGDRNGVMTVGIGHKVQKGEDFSKGISVQDAFNLFIKDLKQSEQYIIGAIDKTHYEKLNFRQKEALVDFVFSRGIGTFKGQKDLIKALQSGTPAAQHLGYNKSIETGKVMAGLSKRALWRMSRFADGNFSDELLKAAQRVYEEGFISGRDKEKLTKGELHGYNESVKEIFTGKIKLMKVD